MASIPSFFATAISIVFFTKTLCAQQASDTAFGARQLSIASISAYTATGDLVFLKTALHDGLNAGLTTAEIKEVLVHLYAYCGFPRSLQGLNTFMAVLETRGEKDVLQVPEKRVVPKEKMGTKYEQGTKTLALLTGQPEKNPKGGYAAFSPVIDTFLKEHLFADIFGRDVLSYADRELATLSALVSMGGVETMLQSHLRIALHLGMSKTALQSWLSFMEQKIGSTRTAAGWQALETLTNSAAATSEIRALKSSNGLFAAGTKAPATNFTGNAWVNILVPVAQVLDCTVGMVTFEPGARTHWHRHPGGQVLLVTEGKGYYQEKGQRKKTVQRGDVVRCPANTAHWHGALPHQPLRHIAISTNAEKGAVVWLQPVTNPEYEGADQ